MIVLGFDTSTQATAVALRLADGQTLERRDDPGPGERPGHATRLLGMADELLQSASIAWDQLERIAVGAGPGSFTGLRVGVATARGLAQSLDLELVGVSSLRALAVGAGAGCEAGGEHLLAVLDARRGEAFAAAYRIASRAVAEELAAPRALAPERLAGLVAQIDSQLGDDRPGRRWCAVGDGAVRFRSELEAAGVTVPPDSARAHLLSAAAICELGAQMASAAVSRAVLPDYRRRPDAEIALERKHRAATAQAETSQADTAEAETPQAASMQAGPTRAATARTATGDQAPGGGR